VTTEKIGPGIVYATGGWYMMNADCLEWMRNVDPRSIDHVITDPPYSQHVHAAQRRGHMRDEPGTGRASFNRSRALDFDHITDAVRADAAASFARIARRWVVVFSDLESAHLWRADLAGAGLEYVKTAIWHKLGSTPQFTGDRPASACEAIVLAHQPGRKRWNGGGRDGFYECPIVLNRGGNSPRVHTTQKPQDLMEAIVRDFSDPGEMVLDPFAGSGTTGVACVRLGRGFGGCERDEKYAQIAVQRLRATREQIEMKLG
jgi:DNA modification methylase